MINPMRKIGYAMHKFVPDKYIASFNIETYTIVLFIKSI